MARQLFYYLINKVVHLRKTIQNKSLLIFHFICIQRSLVFLKLNRKLAMPGIDRKSTLWIYLKKWVENDVVQWNCCIVFSRRKNVPSRRNEDNNLVCCYKFKDKLREESDDTLKWSAVENQSTERQIRRERSTQVRSFSFTSTLQMTAVDKLCLS